MATRQLLPRSERHAALLRAASVAFARGGFQATSMEDVAVEAGVTRLIVYRHFSSKEELYRAVLERVTERLATAIDAQARRPGRPAVVATLLEVAREDREAFQLLWVHARREPTFEDYAGAVQRGAVAFAEQLMGGRVPASAVLHRWSIDYLVTASIEAVLGWLEVGDPAADEQFVALAGEGLAAMVASWPD
jgi:AcrR family transcriptional regulator